jgi:hypothetical protein
MSLMPIRKRTSPTLKSAQARAAALETINPGLDLGSGYSIAVYNTKIEETRKAIEEHNKALLSIEQTSHTIAELERSLATYSTRMLSGVATLYGHTSSEYKMASGPKKRRKPPVAETKADGSPAAIVTA